MHSSLLNRSLLRGMLATALVLAGASACSRSDKTTDGGSQTGAATTTAVDTQTAATGQAPAGAATAAQDTQDTPAEPRQGVSGYQPMAGDNTSDTAARSAASESAADTVAVGDSAQVGKPGQRLEGSEASPRVGDDSLATQPNSERIRPPEDSGETVGTVTTDSAAVAAAPMARDTTADLGQVDTAASQQTDTLAQTAPDTAVLEAQVDTTTQQQDTWEEASADTAAIQVEADTTTAEPQTEVAVDTETDTATVVGDSAEVEKTGERLEPNQTNAEANADTLAVETERVRPPEDSTELLGNVNAEGAEQDADVHANADVQADGGIEADADVEGVGDASAESVGAARVETAGGMVTGAAAVSAVTREGQRCTVLDPESPEARRDMASSPATLNPCGTGTMTLPRIWTGELR